MQLIGNGKVENEKNLIVERAIGLHIGLCVEFFSLERIETFFKLRSIFLRIRHRTSRPRCLRRRHNHRFQLRRDHQPPNFRVQIQTLESKTQIDLRTNKRVSSLSSTEEKQKRRRLCFRFASISISISISISLIPNNAVKARVKIAPEREERRRLPAHHALFFFSSLKIK